MSASQDRAIIRLALNGWSHQQIAKIVGMTPDETITRLITLIVDAAARCLHSAVIEQICEALGRMAR